MSIQDDGTPYRRNYCRACALQILKQSGAELRQIRDVLYGTQVSPAVASHAPPQIQTVGQALVAKNRGKPVVSAPSYPIHSIPTAGVSYNRRSGT